MVYVGGGQACLNSSVNDASVKCGAPGTHCPRRAPGATERSVNSKIRNHADSKPYSFEAADKTESEKGHEDVQPDE